MPHLHSNAACLGFNLGPIRARSDLEGAQGFVCSISVGRSLAGSGVASGVAESDSLDFILRLRDAERVERRGEDDRKD